MHITLTSFGHTIEISRNYYERILSFIVLIVVSTIKGGARFRVTNTQARISLSNHLSDNLTRPIKKKPSPENLYIQLNGTKHLYAETYIDFANIFYDCLHNIYEHLGAVM